MKRTFDNVIDHLLQNEGGYVNHISDPGGHTNTGITLATMRSFYGQHVSVRDLKEISDEQAKGIYRAKYWDAVRGDDLPPGLDYAVFDFAVNSGPGRAAQFLQHRVGARPDGTIGPKTLAAVRGAVTDTQELTDLIQTLNDDRLAWLRGLNHWDTFGEGWTNRVYSMEDVALDLADSAGDDSNKISGGDPEASLILEDIIKQLEQLRSLFDE